jgi:hypothetical protein
MSEILEPLNAFNQIQPKLMNIIKKLASKQSEDRRPSNEQVSDLRASKYE